MSRPLLICSTTDPFISYLSCFLHGELFAFLDKPGGENSFIGNSIARNTEQGSSLSTYSHSFSGTEYSVALIRYCSGRSILVTEKKPIDTARKRSPGSVRSPETLPEMCPGTSLAEQQQQQQEHCCLSRMRVVSITGSASSTTATGRFVLPQQLFASSGTVQKLSSSGLLLNIETFPSLPKSTTFLSHTAIPSTI